MLDYLSGPRPSGSPAAFLFFLRTIHIQVAWRLRHRPKECLNL